MENPKVKTWGVPFWTPGTISDLARSRTVDSQGHRVRVCVVSEAQLSFMWANYSTFSAFSPLSSAEKTKEKSEHPCLNLRNSSSDASWLLQIRAGETRLLMLQFTNRESVQTNCAVIFVHQQGFFSNEFSSDFEGHKSWTERRSSAAIWKYECWSDRCV